MKRPEIIAAILLLGAFAYGLATTPYFRDLYYILDSLTLYSEVGLLAIGMTFVIISGNIDLSVASNLALSACIFAKLAQHMPVGVAAAIGVVCGGILGAFNGILVAYGKLPSFLVTLGTLALYRGAAQALMGAESVRLPAGFIGIDRSFAPLTGIPWPLLIFFLLALALGIVLHKTVFGRWVAAVGANEDAAKYSGVSTNAVKLKVFTLAGLLAGLGAVLMNSRLGIARYDHANSMELDAITAVVLGGASIFGGRGTMIGSVLALLLVAIVRTEMGLKNVTAEYQLTAVGAVLILTVGITALMERRSARGASVAKQ